MSRRQWSDRTKDIQVPLIPGYVFCQVSPGQRTLAVRGPGVIELVSFGGVPGEIPGSEIHAIEALASSGKAVGPWPFLCTGRRVRIERGALSGLEGILVRQKTRYRLVVSVEILQRSVAVEVDREWVRPLTAGPVPATRAGC